MNATEAKQIRAEAAAIIRAEASGWPEPYRGAPFVVVTEQARARHAEAAETLRAGASEEVGR